VSEAWDFWSARAGLPFPFQISWQVPLPPSPPRTVLLAGEARERSKGKQLNGGVLH
jgi:hypothetical protein